MASTGGRVSRSPVRTRASRSRYVSSDLPSASTAGRHVLVATPGFAVLASSPRTTWRTIPGNRWRTVNFAGVDAIHPSLPTDGARDRPQPRNDLNLATN
jgi:hypothetical protein